MSAADLVANMAVDRLFREIPALADLGVWDRDKARESALNIVADAVEAVAYEQFADRPQEQAA